MAKVSHLRSIHQRLVAHVGVERCQDPVLEAGSVVVTRVSVLIHTLNEERNIGNAIRSVLPWADEVVVTDMGSTDRTVDISRQLGAVVRIVERSRHVEPARADAVAAATGEYILVLDADEMVPVTLARRLREIANAGSADVVYLSRRNYLLGEQLRHTGWQLSVDRQPRFFRHGCLVFANQIHSTPTHMPDSSVLALPPTEDLAVVHFNYRDLEEFLSKLNRYTSIEASQYPLDAPLSATTGVIWAVREFWQRYVGWRGLRDGWRGFVLAFLMAGYRLTVWAKLRERWDVGDRSEVERRYAALAAAVLAEGSSPTYRPK